MENSFLNNKLEDTNQGNSEKSPDNQQERFEKLKELLMEAPAIEIEEMKILRNDPRAWEEKALDVINEKAGKDVVLRKELQMASLIEVATLYYDQGNIEAYLNNIEYALDMAHQLKYWEIKDRLQEILG